MMSTQAYYKDRLGFDPNEALNDGSTFDKSQHGYEENLTKFKDERDAIQKKTFTKWVNKHLKKTNRHVEDLFLDLRDGHGLISLLEVLSGEHLPRERGAMRFHMLQNVQIALDFLRYRKIKLVNIRAEDIVDGNPKLTLGLIWTIILHFQISDIVIGQEPNVSARDALLHWARRSTARYPGVRVADFTTSWRDGLAFNAIIHRNRPDLVDWRKIRTCMIRERLEHAFYVAEREYGVTRLLDPEDVDTPEPDEKSLITYISSLYDVFPDPPSIHPLYDSDSQQHLAEYRELARNLNLWMREKLSIMNDRNFPNTLIEIKKLAAESSRFRTSEMPPKQREKQQLAHMFRDLQKYFEAVGEIDMDPDLTIDVLDNKWTTLMAAHLERDQAILEEIKRLDRLQRLAEKVHREMKQVDTHLEELEIKLDEEVKRLDHLHPLDAKHNVDLLEQDLRITEDAIKGLFNDVQILLEGRYQSAPELHKRIQKLHQRWVALRSELHSRLITKLSAVSFPVEERTVTRQTRTVLETRLVDTNIHFRQLQECSEWCRNKLKQLKNAEYGSDLPSVLSELNEHRQDHKIIEQFNTRIDNCIAAKSHFHGDELQLYVHHLNMLQKLYNELLVTSNKRLSDLETLQDFLHSATNEMVWLNEKEEIEVSRDWSEKNLNIPAIEQYYEALMNDLEKREIQFSAVQDRGESLVLQHHPAAKCIESYMTAMQTQWAWLLQLTLCLETHLKHAIFYHKFYLEVHEAEQWISKRDDLLNTTYSQSDFTLDDGERLLKGMQELREELNHYGEIVQELANHSKDVVPLKLRRHPVTKPLPVLAICNCKQSNIAIEKGDQCILHDNSGRVKWRITNTAGVESTVPSVCFLIPPPDKEALDAVDKLKRHYDRSILLWQKKQLRMRQNMIFATIKVVKSWDLAQFLAMGSEQRTAIRRALNEDADKLLQEGDPADPQLRRLRREMEEVNKLFDEFERNARAEEDNKNASRTFSDLISSLKAALDEAEHVMNSRISAPVPRDLDTLEHHVIEHKEFETRLQALNPDVEEVQTFFRRIAKKTPSMQSKLDECLNIWNKLWNCSHLYIERLKCVEIVLSGIEETTNIITEFEVKLASYNELPSDRDSLREIHKNLLNLQNAVTQQQIVIDQLNEDALNARKVVEKSRNNRSQNHDLDRLQGDVTRLTNRWKALCNQLTDRLRSINTAYELLKNYGNSYESQVSWVDGTYDKLNNLSPIGDNAREHLEPTHALLNHVKERAPVIEQVNSLGGQFIREAKQVMEEKYKHCDDSVSSLLLWLSEVEDNLAHQDIVPETSDELRNNISALKQIKDDLDAHSRPVISCIDQIRHLVSSGGDILSADELSTLNKKGNDLKSRYDGAYDRTDKLLKLLVTAGEELSKYRTEINTFKVWLNKAEKCVEEKERSLSNLNKLSSFSDTTREFVSDVIAHQADLRFITMAAQKFIGESKEFVLSLNEYRKTLPRRLPSVEVPQESQVHNEVENVTSQYRDVLSRANLLSDRLSGVGGHQREYRNALDKALSWMKEVEPKANKIVSEPVGADPKSVEEQLSKAKLLKNEVVGQRRLIDHAKQAVSSLLRALEGQQTQSEMSALENPVKELEHKYTYINDALSDKIQTLDAALVQSQGVQDALDSLMQWLNNMENQLKSLTRPASLNIERLEEQLREHKIFYAEIDSHRASVDNVAHSAEELVATASNIRLAKKIETKLKDVTSRFEKLLHKTVKQSELLEEVHHALSIFTTMAVHFEQWHVETLEMIESRDILKLELKDYTTRIDEIAANRDNKRKEFEEVVRNGKQLVGKKDVTDTVTVRDKIKALESMWKDLNNLLDEKQKLTRLRSEQLNAYEKLRDHILAWLSKMENNVSHLQPVAVESEMLKQQIEEIKPLLKEYRDYAHNIDKVNDLGNQYDSLRGERPESPARRRSSLYSPIKKTSVNASPLLRTSQEARSPSPIKSGGFLAQSPLSPSGSSGFSSRRSSQDGFHLEELSIIQQQLVEINNRYSLLGNRLSDRHTELESIREEVKRHLDNMRILSSFLDKVQRSLPKETIPQSKEDAGKSARQVKNILEEMYEKQSLLDSTKTQVLDLLKRKSGALGSDSLHDELTDVVTRWKSLNDSCKSRIKFMEDLKEFYDTHDQISNWLSAKDRMMAALGPISSDSRMVQSQVQQVQVLREEFRTQQPQLDHLMDIGENMMTHIDHTSPDGKRIISRLSTIKQRWGELLKKLEDRAQNLGAAVDTSREFDAGLSRLRDALQGISDQLDDLPLDKDSEEQLRKIENLERQLEGQRPLLADAESAGQQLFEVLSDPASRSEIQGKLSAVGKQYNNLQKKLDHRKAEVEILLRDGRQFEASCAKTLGWLADELGGMSERLLVSADRHVLQQQLDHTEPCYKEVIGKEHEIIMLLNKGRDILNRSNQRSDSRNLQRDLDKIQQQWDRLRKETMERHTRLQTCMEHCHKYYRAQDLFLPWLTQADNKLEMLKPASFRRKDIEQQLKELADFRNEVWKHSGEYENNRTLGDTFINACDIDKDIVKAELHRMKLLWDKLNNNLLEINQSLEDTARRLSDFTENLRDLQHSLQRCEDKLVSHDALGGAAKDPKFLDRLKSLREETDVLKKPLQSVQNQANDLVNQAGEQGIDATDLQDEVENIAERLFDLQAKLDDRCSELQSAATAVTQFSDQVKGVTSNLTDLERELDSMKPPGRDLKTVRNQLEDVHRVLRKIEKSADNVASTVLAGDKLVDSGFAPDSAATREQVESLKRYFGRLEERAKQREEEVESVLGRLENFYQIHTAVIEDIADVNEHVKKFRAVSSEVEGIKVQQEDFRSFHQSYIDPLSHQVEDCNKVGQGLIQSAAGGVNTTNLEKDLEKMNDKWNDLKYKLNERGRKLDVGLLQSGKFQEALDGLAKWLTDTEEMVANQKPPSADYKVVKAQLQEQKFLKKMLLDRQNSMSSLFAMGSEVIASADPMEKKAVERQLRELMQRFDRLTQGAADRMLALEHAMKIAKEFQDKLLVLVDWLDHTEKKVKAMELLPTDEERIQKRIKEHNVLHSDIIGKKSDFAELTEVASTLMTHVGEEEASVLADKLQDTTDRYTTLVEHSESLLHVLETSRAGLRHLVLGYQDLQSWMDNVEQRLNKYRVLTVHTDRLLEQMQDLADLTEEIANRQSQVDSTVDSGLELMKHISNDEALQLKDKLDTLQRRYNDLTSKGTEYLKHAQEALPLVQQFYNCHNRLVGWMMGAEAQLQSAEPREEHIHQLEIDIQEFRPVLETINQIGPQLCQMSPGEGSSTIEGLVTRDNRRFDAIAEQIQRKGERIQLSKQRSLEVIGDIDELLDWFREVDSQLREADAPSSDPDVIRVQLKEHKALNDDISGQKSRVRDVLSSAKKVLRESAQHEDISVIREKMEDLRDTMDTVSKLSSDRLGILEQALPLAEHFHETHAGLSAWLDDVEQQVSVLSMPALRPDLIAQQQDRNEIFTQSISEHRPLVEKLNKTGEALIKLCNDEEGSKVQDILDNDNARYAALRGELRTRQQVLEKALQESSLFTDKLEGMLRALSSAVDQVSSADPISAHPPRIHDQLDENCSLIEDLDKREEAYAALKRAANDVINKAGNKADPAVKDIKNKLDRLNSLWNEVQKSTSCRGKSLEDALAAAEKFWNELTAVMGTLQELQESLGSQEPPAVQPAAIKVQQVALQEIKHEIDQTKPEVDRTRQTGQELMNLCGEPDKPEVKKHIEDLDSAWDNITALYAKREENLIDAMEKAMEFHETLQNLQSFLDEAEDRFTRFGTLGSDIDAVKKQIEQLKYFKIDVDPHMVKIEALNRQAQELTERTSMDQAASIKEPLVVVNRRWDELLRGMVERQRQLENALLRLGQFQHALAEILVWINKTNATVNELKPVAGDPQVLEVELAKLKVLVNDIQAHQTSVDTLNDAGRQIIESGKGTDEASSTQERLSELNRSWRDLLQKAADRQRELEDALKEAQRFNAELQDMLLWLSDVDSIIAASKPVGGLPETASEQLERFMEVYNELDQNRPKVETLVQQGQEYLKKSSPSAASNLQHTLRTLKNRWDSVLSRANDKKIKLEIALKEATEFHDALQAFVDWLTNAEKTLSNLKPVSRVLETILSQIEDHKTFQKDVGVHRETMLNLDKKGTHLKYFSQKQDVILIKNLLISVQHRWERVVSKSAERTRALDHGYKEAKDFHDSWSGLMTWLNETEQSLDELAVEASGIGNDPEKIKMRLAKHREFQRALSGKQATYDIVMKAGKTLKERAPKTDEPHLRQMLSELKNKWTVVCAKSVDRQRKLEEALLFSGQFKDAIQALLEWLQKMEKNLSDHSPVHGDLDTVMALLEKHKTFEEDLKSRSAQMESVQRTGQDLEAKATATDAATIHSQLSELKSLWSKVTSLSDKKTGQLEEALKQAEKLHKAVHMLLEWLSDAEMKLRFAGPLPEDEQETYNQLEEHEKFMREMREKEYEKNDTIRLAQDILAKAHPDGATVIKHWITIIQSRWEEVSTWASQREQRLKDHLRSLRDLEGLLEELLKWLSGLEKNLFTLEAVSLPDSLPELEVLISEHRSFMENTSQRQAEVDSICKSRQTKPATMQQQTRDRKISRPKTPTSTSRVSPSHEKVPNHLPHIGPRFAADGSKGTEPQFRNPRVKSLWDKWRNVWMLAWDRQRRLQEKYNYLLELEKVKNFSWDDWRKRFLKFMNHKKSRLTDLFRKMDKNNDGLIPREDFIDGIMKTKFETSRLEMNTVADLFDRQGEGLIDWKEFIAALRPDWEERKPATESDKIHDEVKRLVMLCTCRQKFRVFQVGEGKYRFGDSQKLRLVRILRSTVMVRVGGGWVALEEFLVKNDPCRAKGRTNIELREQFILADGVSQSMTAFKPKASPQQRSHSVAGPITKVREKSTRSVPMGSRLSGRTSVSGARTPDSLSDNESTSYLPRKASAPSRSTLTPGGSLPGSKAGSRPSSRPGSRPASRQGSKPPSRHGSNLSLDSTDDGTPSRIPVHQRRVTPSSSSQPRTSTATASKKSSLPLNGIYSGRPKTPTGISSPISSTSRTRTPSGSSTPVSGGTKLTRKPSGASDISSETSRKNSKGSTPTEMRAPFRL